MMKKIEIFFTRSERTAIDKRMIPCQPFASLVREVAENDRQGLADHLRDRPASPGFRKGIKVRLPEDLAAYIKDQAKAEKRSSGEYLMLRLLAVPEIPGAKARTERPRRILDHGGLIIAREVLIANLLRSYLEVFSRHANCGEMKEAMDLFRRLHTDINIAIHCGGPK